MDIEALREWDLEKIKEIYEAQVNHPTQFHNPVSTKYFYDFIIANFRGANENTQSINLTDYLTRETHYEILRHSLLSGIAWDDKEKVFKGLSYGGYMHQRYRVLRGFVKLAMEVFDINSHSSEWRDNMLERGLYEYTQSADPNVVYL